VRLLAEAVRSVFGLGLDTLRDIGGYILAGAMIVLPIWLLTRIFDRR
jgi:hypothetical protein